MQLNGEDNNISSKTIENQNNLEQLDNIFNSIRSQISQWGKDAKWKIDLVLLDNAQPKSNQNNLQHLLSPQVLHPNSVTNTNNEKTSFTSLPITPNTQYPWDYATPSKSNTNVTQPNELELKLSESFEKQKYLENIIWSQAEQIKHSPIKNVNDNAIDTMKNIFLMSQNEQKLHNLIETNLLQKDNDILSKKLKQVSTTLEAIESMDDEGDLKAVKRKLYLANLRLTARNAEIDYLHQVIQNLKHSSPKNSFLQLQKKKLKGPPYLFQQQFSPRSDVRTLTDQHPLSGLDSLGILADQMLSDPEFESSNTHAEIPERRPRSKLDDRRSQRSIDSAATLLAMPQLMSLQKTIYEEPKADSPELPKSNNFDHIPKKPRSTYTRWTEEEDKLLRKAVKKYGHSNWESCSRDIKGRSNIQCRNRWIRHLEHKPAPPGSSSSESETDTPVIKKRRRVTSARHSPSIASLLNNNHEEEFGGYSPRYTPNYLHPTYTPPSPVKTPKHGRRRMSIHQI